MLVAGEQTQQQVDWTMKDPLCRSAFLSVLPSRCHWEGRWQRE